ncbi:MAG TPA: metalloregulator ArsR/SmtB family transcription factor [Steroidobacteraceae bacterium]|nr:metalloregulator ArsR/SmtB family transcription factor [Steroidobacteraceae bacterium]
MNLDRAFDALGDRTRRRIFLRLREGPQYAGDLVRGMRVTRSAVSQHLQVLKAAGLVSVQVEGTRRLYHVDPKGVEAFRNELDRFWSQTLTAYKALVEKADEDET